MFNFNHTYLDVPLKLLKNKAKSALDNATENSLIATVEFFLITSIYILILLVLVKKKIIIININSNKQKNQNDDLIGAVDVHEKSVLKPTAKTSSIEFSILNEKSNKIEYSTCSHKPDQSSDHLTSTHVHDQSSGISSINSSSV